MAPVYQYETPAVYRPKPIPQASPQPQSLILNLPWETRCRILRFATPTNVNLIYDPKYLLPNDPIKRPSCEAALSLFLTSRQVYHEVATVFYASNILTFIKPIRHGDCRSGLAPEAICRFRTVEVCLEADFAEMGRIWLLLSHSFHSVTELTLNMIRARDIVEVLGELMWRSEGPKDRMGPLGELRWRSEEEKPFTLTLEIHNTGFRSGVSFLESGLGFDPMLGRGMRRAGMYNLKRVPNLKKVNVKISLGKDEGDILLSYRCPVDQYARLHFSKDGDRDTPETRYLIWTGREEGQGDLSSNS